MDWVYHASIVYLIVVLVNGQVNKLPPPSNVRVVQETVSHNSMSVHWDPVVGANTYEVSVSPPDGVLGAGQGITDTNVILRNLRADTQYRVQVGANNGAGLGEYRQVIAKTLSVCYAKGMDFSKDVFTITCPARCVRNQEHVYGTREYTEDSYICAAAVHDGRIDDNVGGEVVVKKRPGLPHYVGTGKHGVLSQDYGSWHSSFVFGLQIPKNFRVQPGSIAHNTFTLEWDKVRGADAYRISVVPDFAVVGAHPVIEDTKTTLTNLKPDTEYKVNLTATNTLETSEAATTTITTTKTTTPSKPKRARWEQWSDWEACSVSCGSGTQGRSRACIGGRIGRRGCRGGAKQNRDCNDGECVTTTVTTTTVKTPKPRPRWSQWTDWEPCSSSCGQGTTTRTRNCMHGRAGRRGCRGKKNDRKTCNEGPCVVKCMERKTRAARRNGRRCKFECFADSNCDGGEKCVCDGLCGKTCQDTSLKCINILSVEEDGTKISCSNGIYIGSKCTFTCEVGYSLRGSTDIYCQGSTKWTNQRRLPKCILSGPPPKTTPTAFITAITTQRSTTPAQTCTFKNDVQDACCGSSPYYSKRARCCNGKIRAVSPAMTECCGTRAYNPKKSGCCDNSLFKKSNQKCEDGKIVKN